MDGRWPDHLLRPEMLELDDVVHVNVLWAGLVAAGGRDWQRVNNVRFGGRDVGRRSGGLVPLLTCKSRLKDPLMWLWLLN